MTKKINPFKEPTAALQDAIEKLTLFAHPETARLDVSEDGRLVASQKLSPINRMIGLAQCYITPLFSDQAKHEQEKKLHQIKQEILRARDTLKSHSSLIEKLKQGDETQKKLAHSALEMIQHYNAIISQDSSTLASKYDFYNYERNRLLLDSEIKDQAIELPQTFSLKFDSHANSTAQNTIKELSNAFILKENLSRENRYNPTYKKTDQFMIDTFRMKTIRMLQNHPVQLGSMNEMVGLVKSTPIETMEENPHTVTLRQMFEYCPGFHILLTGSFKKNGHENKLMNMPILEDLRLNSEISHSGSPYPAQHIGTALSEKLIEANPLRSEQVPLFQLFSQRKTKLAQSLLHDPDSIARSRHHLKLSRHIFDDHRQEFLALQREMHLLLIQEEYVPLHEAIGCLDAFFEYASAALSPFTILTHAQQKLNDLYIRNPANKLEEQWLTAGTILRTGTSQEKNQCTKQILLDTRKDASLLLLTEHPVDRYVRMMGEMFGTASQSVILQYFSEKIGFAPPLLSDFERKLQTCAFRQTELLFEDYENAEPMDEVPFKQHLKSKCHADMSILQSATIDDLNLNAALLTHSLEIYFNSRWSS